MCRKETDVESIWSKSVQIPKREPLTKDIKTEVAVIGGGMAGILTAFLLKKSGIPAVVLEADRIGSGQTKDTTAKITSQHGCSYHKLLRQYGEGKARLYARAQEAAILEYDAMIRENHIDCHFERLPSYLYTEKQENKKYLQEEAEAAAWLGLPARFQDCTKEFPVDAAGAVCFERQAQFHPLEFIREISRELEIYEQTRALSVKGRRIDTDRGVSVWAEHVVFAAHYPFLNVPGFYFARQHQERSYVVTYEDAGRFPGMYYGIDSGGLSFRNYENLLLIGGSGHRTGENQEGGRYRELRNRAEALFPNAREIAFWSAQDCMPHDGLPFIGIYSMFRRNWYVISGFHKWGMTSSMVAAMMIRDQVCGVENPYASLFSPQRMHLLVSAKPACTDIMKSTKGLLRGLFLPSGRKGEFHGTPSRCPHMGCGLIWNPDEESWDCPCHGSRFDCHGNLKDNPAQQGLYKKEGQENEKWQRS